jgi:hypothetical protein
MEQGQVCRWCGTEVATTKFWAQRDTLGFGFQTPSRLVPPRSSSRTQPLDLPLIVVEHIFFSAPHCFSTSKGCLLFREPYSLSCHRQPFSKPGVAPYIQGGVIPPEVEIWQRFGNNWYVSLWRPLLRNRSPLSYPHNLLPPSFQDARLGHSIVRENRVNNCNEGPSKRESWPVVMDNSVTVGPSLPSL